MTLQNLLDFCDANFLNQNVTVHVPAGLFQLEDANYHFRRIINDNLPHQIGVYVWADHLGNVIYVGKAGTLKKGTLKKGGATYSNHTIPQRNLASRGRDHNGKDISTAVYVRNIIQKQNWPAIHITAITFDVNDFAPGFVEVNLLHHYLRTTGTLPLYNKSL